MHEKKRTILVIEDDSQIRRMLDVLLDAENSRIVESTSGKQALRMLISTKPDLVLLDLGLPDMDGKNVVAAIREWSQVPIIILSARMEDEEVVAALDIGANDYITKPFNANVLMARINAAMRSAVVHEVGESELRNGHLRINLVQHKVFVNDTLTPFTPKEYDLLRYFMVNRGKMLTHKEILKKIWGVAHVNDTTYLRVYIGQIREKIEKNPASNTLIITEPGIGYRMETIPPAASHAA